MKIVIPSQRSTNLLSCVQAIITQDSTISKEDIIVINDGLDMTILDSIKGIIILPGIKPFIFSRNVNIGIRFTQSDVILLNDDAFLTTLCGFNIMKEVSQINPSYGIIAAATNHTGFLEQTNCTPGLNECRGPVAFICVYIPYSTFEKVGYLDEETFTSYGYDDNDYCRRVRNAGLKIGVIGNVFVDHKQIASTFRGFGHGDINSGRELYLKKWGSLIEGEY